MRGIIYPILNSPCLIPVQLVPNKGGMTIVLNEKNELILIRTVARLRIYIGYTKLYKAKRKDHFPLPFINQMLDSWQVILINATCMDIQSIIKLL